MKSFVLAVAATVLLAVPAFAQDAGPPPGAAPPAEAGAPMAGPAKGGKMKAAMQACRDEVKAQGVKGPDRKQAITDCVNKQHPELAGRMQCRQEAKAKGLSGDEMRTFMRSCIRGNG